MPNFGFTETHLNKHVKHLATEVAAAVRKMTAEGSRKPGRTSASRPWP